MLALYALGIEEELFEDHNEVVEFINCVTIFTIEGSRVLGAEIMAVSDIL